MLTLAFGPQILLLMIMMTMLKMLMMVYYFQVTSHEICHVFGMSHCAYFACAMNESKSILQAESQPLFLCPICLRKLQKAMNFDIVERYKAICTFLDLLMKCNGFQKETSDCKFESSLCWLKSVLMFIENKTTI